MGRDNQTLFAGVLPERREFQAPAIALPLPAVDQQHMLAFHAGLYAGDEQNSALLGIAPELFAKAHLSMICERDNVEVILSGLCQ